MKTVDFSETIEACDLKVGRYRQLIDFMKVQYSPGVFSPARSPPRRGGYDKKD